MTQVAVQVDEILAFIWPRGYRQLWDVSADRQGRRPPLLVYRDDSKLKAGGWPQHWENPYQPLKEPTLCEDFAELGRQALIVGERLAVGVTPVDCATMDKSLHAQVREFSKDYGPLRYLNEEEIKPHLYGRRWLVGMEVRTVLQEAVALHEMVRLAKEIQDDREAGRQTDLEEKLWELGKAIAGRLAFKSEKGVQKGVREGPAIDRERWQLVRSATCEDLLSAVWYQFYLAEVGSQRRRVCKGCGRLFGLADTRQVYHSTACRNRAGVKRFSEKQRRRKEA